MAYSRPCRGLSDRVVGLAAVSWPSAACRHDRVVACLATQRPCLLPLLVTIHHGVLQYKPSHSSPCCHDTMSCIPTQFSPSQHSSLSQYTRCIVTHFPATQAAAVTIQSLYRDTACLPSQGNPYCNTPPAHCTSKGHVTIQFSIVS